MKKTDIKSLTLNELSAVFAQSELPSFRSKQVYDWLQKKGVQSFDNMTNLPKELREKLADIFVIKSCKIEKKLVSGIDGTVKYLFKLYDGEFVESVLMKYKFGYTLCVSSQVGCKMGCKFCASTLNGCVRNLSAAEILSQIHAAQNDMDVRISHIVLMGMGEPLDNFENVVRFITLVTDENGLNISARNVTLSTSGIVPKIKQLQNLRLPITLSVSLHAPNDKIRSSIMPVNDSWGIEELLDACKEYSGATKRRVSFEYALIDGVNDSDECAYELARRIKGTDFHINLIPVNEVSENNFSKSGKKRIEKFSDILIKNNVNATLRRTLGSDINASCGQLRRAQKEVVS